MLESAEEFVRLLTSKDADDQRRAAYDEASVSTWLDIIERFPEKRLWVAYNKTVPVEVLEVLRHDPDGSVQGMVRMKRSWQRAHPDDTSRPKRRLKN